MTWSGTAVVYGEAATQGSKRLVRAGGTGRPLMVDDNPRLKNWRGQLQAAMLQCAPSAPIDAPVWVRLRVYVPRPRSHYGTGKNADKLKETAPFHPCTGKDLDKIQRAVGDAGTGIWWRDDNRICAWDVCRLYDARERVEVSSEVLR